jgi:hypothetical protein
VLSRPSSERRRLEPGVAGNLADRGGHRVADDLHADLLAVALDLELSSALRARSSATPPPGTTPSSIAARVACSASSTRAFFSFSSASLAHRR